MSRVSIDMLYEMDARSAMSIVLAELSRRNERGGLDRWFPDDLDNPLGRHRYPKHMKMFAKGADHLVRAALGGNRVGKSILGSYEVAAHLTGLYPQWWQGKRYEDGPILAWSCGTKGVKVRDNNQKELIGTLKVTKNITRANGGMVPSRVMSKFIRKGGVVDAIDRIAIQHRLGWENVLAFKSYEEGRPAFEAEAVDFIHLDEQPPAEIYVECQMRTLTTKGRMLLTLTPVEGMTETVVNILEDTDLL